MSGAQGRLDSNPRCPFCGAIGDGFTGVTDDAKAPAIGDVAVCLYCCEVQVYDFGPQGITIRRPTAAEAAKLAVDPEIQHAVTLTRAIRERGGFEHRGRIQ